jgi:hypothetical protein
MLQPVKQPEPVENTIHATIFEEPVDHVSKAQDCSKNGKYAIKTTNQNKSQVIRLNERKRKSKDLNLQPVKKISLYETQKALIQHQNEISEHNASLVTEIPNEEKIMFFMYFQITLLEFSYLISTFISIIQNPLSKK